MTCAEKLDAIMGRHKLTRQHVGEVGGFNAGHVSYMLAGKRPLQPALINTVAILSHMQDAERVALHRQGARERGWEV